uniref:Uncharacterized protein n=1 Tax=Trypanosoma congolense (strain IL3000) TaxID=1068625 RepID=G0UP76_TRYCI|nr:conserved hypothetical protein [Trypanosoma congolense IL3000]
MERSCRKEEGPLWHNSNVHAWKTKNDITVVNLRNASEQLPSFASSSRQNETVLHTNSRKSLPDTVGGSSVRVTEPTKQESLNELLALMHRKSEQQRASPKGTTTDLISSATTEERSSSSGPNTKGQLFPESKPSKAMDVEFVQGVNFPGERSASSLHVPPRQGGVQAVALFHDPVWGEVAASSNADFFEPQAEQQSSAIAGLRLNGDNVGFSNNDIGPSNVMSAAPTALSPAAPLPPFKASGNAAGATFPPQSQPLVMASPPAQLGYAQSIGLSPGGWANAAPQARGATVGSYQFVGVPVQFMPQSAMMAMPQAYRMQYPAYPVQAQPAHITQVMHQPAVYRPPSAQELHQVQYQKGPVPQDATPRPGTNVGAAPFVPGGRSI